MKTWFTITNKSDAASAEIDIFDEIGVWGVSVKDFATQLKAIPADRAITLRINSPGGSIFDGFAIYNQIAERRDKVTAKIIGLAASMATIIMCAAKTVSASENSTLMIHNPAAVAFGESSDMREMADLLDKLKGQLVNTYIAKTGKKEAEVVSAMDAVTWFTAAEAKAWGLVDEVTNPVKATASFDLTRFGAVPTNISGGAQASTNQTNTMNKLLKALAEAKLIAAVDVSEDTAVAQFGAAFAENANSINDLTTANADLQKKLDTANVLIANTLKATAEATVAAAVKAGRVKDDATVRAKWVEAYVRDEAGTKAMLDGLPEAKSPRGVAPVQTQTNESPGNKKELTGLERVTAAFKSDSAK
jgi:ATP-dependent Clp endopeptidase proteolytic subunit ClpP